MTLAHHHVINEREVVEEVMVEPLQPEVGSDGTTEGIVVTCNAKLGNPVHGPFD